jgi:hypothetical protein
MRIYFAGNFLQAKNPEQEERVQRKVPHSRLISYYYKDPWAMSVLKVFKKRRKDEDVFRN